jgi:hypothetical protein
MSIEKNNDCQVCKYIRWYLMIGMPVLFITWMRPELNLFRGLDLSRIAASLIIISLVSLVAWKYYHERKQ